jgi:hypothetical protein
VKAIAYMQFVIAAFLYTVMGFRIAEGRLLPTVVSAMMGIGMTLMGIGLLKIYRNSVKLAASLEHEEEPTGG